MVTFTSAKPTRTLPAACEASHVVRPRVEGKFLFVAGAKFYVRGVTYGPFHPDAEGCLYHDPQTVDRDFAAMESCGINAVRVYTIPPGWLLDAALRHGLRVMVGIPWEQHITFLESPQTADNIVCRVREGVRACRSHPAILCFAIGNEIPSSIVRWHGARKTERFLRRLCAAAKQEDPAALVTYVNFPPTEYLDLSFVDFLSFNVYLERQDRLGAYLARLQTLAGNRPLLMAEVGLDSRRNGLVKQAETLEWQVRTVFSSGAAGMFLFAWTDEWSRGGFEIEDWDFGLTTREREAKPALVSTVETYAAAPFFGEDWPSISVVVCSYNGSRTIRQTLDGVTRLDYPHFEVIVVNDGSTDQTGAIAGSFPGVRVLSTPNRGLSAARNVGMHAAAGEIIAYIDDDAYPDPHWLHYLGATYRRTDFLAIGGPNLPPPGDGPIAECVANAPGGPIHVLLTDEVAEHIPGCNFSVRRAALEAIGGFDPIYRAAGDDVDACWRLQQHGKIGFAPAAVVWHHRRNSVKAYWKQQKGYGTAEALLERKWPGKYNETGHLSWAGRLYGPGLVPTLGRPSRVYYGTWGSALFQRVYEPLPGALQSLAQMPEWHLVTLVLAAITLLGFAWPPLFGFGALLAVALGLSIAQAASGAMRAKFPSRPRGWLDRARLTALTFFLFLMQPIARLWGRVAHDLTPWRPIDNVRRAKPRRRVVQLWSERWRSAEDWLASSETALPARWASRRGADWDPWDLEIRGGLAGAARVRLAVEEHGAGKQLLRWEVRPVFGRFIGSVGAFKLALAVAACAAGEWAAVVPFALLAGAIGIWIHRDCGVATGSVLQALERLAASADARSAAGE